MSRTSVDRSPSLCYTAMFTGREGPWPDMTFINPNTGAEHYVDFNGPDATLTCAEVKHTRARRQRINQFNDVVIGASHR